MTCITVSKATYVDVDIEVDLEEEIDSLSDKDKAKLAAKLGASIPRGLGDGDAARTNNLIDRAYHAARTLPNLPREIADLFWHVHGRAI